MKLSVEIQGGKELASKLARLADAVAGQALADAVTQGAMVILAAAQEKAPVRTGALRRSLHARVTDSARNSAEAEVGTWLNYAASVEFGGTVQHPGGTPYIVIEGKGAVFLRKDGSYPPGVRFTRPHAISMPARPYLRPALDETRGAVVEEIGSALKQLLERAAR